MNSFVSVDREEDEFSFHGDPIKSEEDSSHGGDSCSSSAGSVVLLLPKENVVVEASEDEASPDVIPITVDNIPVYLSRSPDGTPLFIRCQPPTMEELLLTSPDEGTQSFDGFSEASGKTFEGFSETSGRTFDGFSEASGSTFEGFSEASRCSSAGSNSFEGFTDEIACVREEDTASTPFNSKTVTRTDQSNGASCPSFQQSRKRRHNQMNYADEGLELDCPSKDKVDAEEDESIGTRTRKRTRSQVKEEEVVCAAPPLERGPEHRPFDSPPTQREDLDVLPKEMDEKFVAKQNTVESPQVSPSKRKRGRPRSCRNTQIEAGTEGSIDNQPEDFIGKYCNRIGCTISWLESFRTMRITPINGIVYELSEFANRIAWEQDYVAIWLLRLCGHTNVIPTAEDHAKIRVILKRRKALTVTLAGQKFGSAKLQEFDETDFILPTASELKMERISDEEQIIESLGCDVKRSKRQRVPKPLEEIEETTDCLGSDTMYKEEVTSPSNLETSEVKEEPIDNKSLDDSSFYTSQTLDIESAGGSSFNSCQTPSGTDDTTGLETGGSRGDITEVGEKKDTGGSKFKGTLGISKSGRVRKPSAKGSVSIEFKYLFMEKQGPFSELSNPSVSTPQRNESEVVKRTYKKSKTNQPAVQRVQTVKKCFIGPRHLNKYIDMENKLVSFTLEDGRVIPYFKELDYNLGPRSCAVGLTVGDLNTKDRLDIRLSNGIIKELFDFYISRGSTLTSLVCRLFWMLGVPHDPGRILSTTSKIGVLGRTLKPDHPKANEEFSLPEKMPFRIQRPSVKTLQNKIKKSGKVLRKYHSSRRRALSSKLKHSKLLSKKAGSKMSTQEGEASNIKKKSVTTPSSPQSEDLIIDEDMIKTRGKEGSITRGDIVYLYTQWLRNKKKLGSNVFVTDLLKDVEQLMAERKVKLIRVPAGTLMSSSVKLYDEYNQMCNTNKEDAMMYLEDDWLEDIQYLLSQSRPIRRNTFEGDSASCKTDPEDTGSQQDIGEDISDSDYSVRSLIIDEGSDEGKLHSGIDLKKSLATDGLFTSRSAVSTRVRSVVRGALHGRREESFQRKTRQKSIKKNYFEDFVSDFEDIDAEVQYIKEKSMATESSKGETKKLNKFENSSNRKMQGAMFSPSMDEYEVERILDFRYIRDSEKERLQYLVRWVGFNQDDDSWVDEKDLDCPKILEDFWETEDFCRTPVYGRKKEAKVLSTSEKCEDEIRTHPTLQKMGDSNKENSRGILEVLLRHVSGKKPVGRQRVRAHRVSVQAILELYDTWRRENQNVLMAGGSNTVNVETLVKRVKKLMVSKKVEKFHPESLLNACFMMTLIRTRLKSEETLKEFLDGNCLDVLEASHKQQLASREKHKSEEGISKKADSDKSMTIQNLQNELQELQCNLTLAEGTRLDSRNTLSLVEDEVECLENICRDRKNDSTDLASCVKHELERVRESVRKSVMKGHRENETGEGKASKVSDATKTQLLEEKASVDSTTMNLDNEKVLMGTKKELTKLGIQDEEAHNVMEMVIHKIGGRMLRARPQKVGVSKSV
ncbi:uncharacterized protein LOC122247951 [Penaeus japonicus]|uniref:uncharacterized protein LOC122247951 n=1 Tax=Penaeus japonicus TaxID=27405 RepID=UPI001C7165EE|nr:uncharacterized protein LOC122247951 [Penaeus japonicus]